ncbi:hypothetical protein NE237_006758 [Protea cynaroides]|uniref:DYW domain-containing protein n=1 Tax=Protea cynaroides TaxID=273540 RepID=A0A9Q0KNS2_9MAGN|nr:hypothetical protein NE237_006758 [Protea cynaroides]
MTLYMPLFRSCNTPRKLLQLHAHLLTSGLHRDALVSTKLIESYARMGSLESTRLVFDTFSRPDPFMWGVLIKCYVWNYNFKEAIILYHDMLYQRAQVSSFLLPSLLRACSGLGDVDMGAKIHGKIIKSGFDSDVVVETALLSMYGEKGELDAARAIFDKMSTRDVICWSSIICSYVQDGQPYSALEMFQRMVFEGIALDSVAMLGVTEACADLGCLRIAKAVHGYIVRREIENAESLEISLIVMYSKCADLHGAEKLFEKASHRSNVSWTAMVSCYNQSSRFQKALDICVKMHEFGVVPNSVTMASFLFSCSQLGLLKEGRSIHGYVIRQGIDPDFDLVGPGLINMYASCGSLGDSQKVFDAIKDKQVVSWNSLIAVYARNGFLEEALRLFIQLLAQGLFVDSFTLASSLSACGNMSFLRLGDQIHGHIAKTGFDSNEYVQNSLIDLYSKCGSVSSAYQIFSNIKRKNIITWNSMVGGFAQNGYSLEAIGLFDWMHSKGLSMDKVTFLSVIQACSHLGYLEKGKWVHHKLIVYGIEKDSHVETALTDMYAKCGDLQMAQRVFDDMLERTVVSWSAMIGGYGMHGHIDVAISLFTRMVDSEIKPNEITFMNILSACSHAGSVEKGKYYYNLMEDFGMEPSLDHFTCMVDLLCRAGDFDGAFGFIKSMPVPANASIWGAVLNGCRIHHRMDLIRSIEESLLDLEKNNSGHYTLLSNIYAEEEKWDKFAKVRSMMKHVGMRKVPGYSIVEINRRIYRFGAGDTSHPQTKEIYRSLENLINLAQGQGYALDATIHSTSLGPRSNNVKSHSEKLAIAFGVISSAPGATIRISKNLRVCLDCHTFAKNVSKITGREIIMRDLNRFHHFINGSCSCRDYW